ncbi:MAG: HAD family hydrolase [Candidatus Hodarchaeales archaeon]
MIKVILVDFDGTMADLPTDDEAIRKEAGVDRVGKAPIEIREKYEREALTKLVFFRYSDGLIGYFRNMGVPLAIVSNNLQSTLDHIFNDPIFSLPFQRGVIHIIGDAKKPLCDSRIYQFLSKNKAWGDEVLVIGDSDVDEEFAHVHGFQFLRVKKDE